MAIHAYNQDSRSTAYKIDDMKVLFIRYCVFDDERASFFTISYVDRNTCNTLFQTSNIKPCTAAGQHVVEGC